MLFALADELDISDTEKADIEAILKTSTNGTFMTKPINDAYSFNDSAKQYSISFDKDEISIPADLLTAESKVTVYVRIITQIDLEQLSEMVRSRWSHSHEISLIIDCLASADNSVAKDFIMMNEDRITAFYPVMIAVDPKSAIRLNKEKNVRIDFFIEHRWHDSLLAFKALCKSDKSFSVQYLKRSIIQFSEAYSDVCALDFTSRDALDLLKEIEKIDRESYFKIVSGINRDKILNRWDQCGGISPRKRQWVNKRKKEYFGILGLPI